MQRLLITTLALGALLSAAVFAAGPLGIGFVEAPERATGVCTGKSPEQAFACARQKCAQDGVAAVECRRVAWCFPAGWSFDLFVQHREGAHWHEFSCGWDSEEMARAAARLRCDRQSRPHLADCSVTRLFDPDGRELTAER